MNKDELIEKQEVIKIVKEGGYITEMIREINSLPVCDQKARPVAEIERAKQRLQDRARAFEKKSRNPRAGVWTKRCAKLLSWVLEEEQDDWTDEDLLGKEGSDEKQ